MNKQKFLDVLAKDLEKNNVEEIDDIIEQYNEHFSRKLADGFSEEEIALKLGKPEEVAAQYESNADTSASKQANKIPLAIGIGFADIWIVSFFAIVFAWDLALAVLTLAFGFLGICLVVAPGFITVTGTVVISYIPYLPGAITGIACIALGVVSAVLTINCYMLAVKLGTAWLRWQKNVLSGKKNIPYSVFPLFKNSFKYKLRKVIMISLAVFGVLFVIGFISMALCSGRIEFWHAWRWFNYAG
ncbi:MAG: DUF1700 domain-containing protein [Bacillota bacterium]|nr:DUF1700 domain-containing protein [Bacillota bacterium]